MNSKEIIKMSSQEINAPMPAPPVDKVGHVI